MINGTITSQGSYADGRDMCEIYISRLDSHKLSHQRGKKTIIYLTIGNDKYEGGVHETKDGTVWISSVLKKGGSIPTRLVDVLKANDMEKGDKIILTFEKKNVCILKKSQQ